VFKLTGPNLPYDSYTGDTVHRLFHMWQQSDCNVANKTPSNPSGCLNDLYPFVGIARDDSGGNSMGFTACAMATCRCSKSWPANTR
jgi:phospholipase C